MLEDIKILEIASLGGALVGKQFASLGAFVLKVEPLSGAKSRDMPPLFFRENHRPISLVHWYLNMNKASVTLNLDAIEGHILFKELVQYFNVLVIEEKTRRQLEYYNTWENLKNTYKGIILCLTEGTDIVTEGAFSDLLLMAASGMLSICGEPDKPPVRPGGGLLGYQIQSLYGAFGVLTALLSIQQDRLTLIEVPATAAVASFAWEIPSAGYVHTGQIPRRAGVRHPASTVNALFECNNGFVYIVANSADEWERLRTWIFEVTGNQTVLNKNYEGSGFDRLPFTGDIHEIVSSFSGKLSKEYLFKEGQRRKIAVVPLNTPEELLQNEHLNNRGFFERVQDPNFGAVLVPKNPIRFSNYYYSPSACTGELGADNLRVLQGLLGFSKEKIEQLVALGVI